MISSDALQVGFLSRFLNNVHCTKCKWVFNRKKAKQSVCDANVACTHCYHSWMSKELLFINISIYLFNIRLCIVIVFVYEESRVIFRQWRIEGRYIQSTDISTRDGHGHPFLVYIF